jgi:hypothetical protein
MIPLAHGVAILDEHASLAHLETSAPLLAALSAAAICCHTYFYFSSSPKLLGGNIVNVGEIESGLRLQTLRR